MVEPCDGEQAIQPVWLWPLSGRDIRTAADRTRPTPVLRANHLDASEPTLNQALPTRSTLLKRRSVLVQGAYFSNAARAAWKLASSVAQINPPLICEGR